MIGEDQGYVKRRPLAGMRPRNSSGGLIVSGEIPSH